MLKYILLTFLTEQHFSACPVRYTEMLSNSSRACLRFVATPATYPNASRNCTSDGGDLIKIDTQTMLLNFLAFISSKYDQFYMDRITVRIVRNC